MNDYWVYDSRSQDALNAFKKAIELKKQKTADRTVVHENKWNILSRFISTSTDAKVLEDEIDNSKNKLEDFNTDKEHTDYKINNTDDNNTKNKYNIISKSDISTLTDNCDKAVTDIIDIFDDSVNSNEKDKQKSTDDETQVENITDIIEQIKEGFKANNEKNNDLLTLIFVRSDTKTIFKILVDNVSDNFVLNMSKSFCDLSQEEIYKYSVEFYDSFLLPIILNRKQSREIECAVFECIEKLNFKNLCSFLLVPLLLRPEPNIFSVSFVGKLSKETREFILNEYLSKFEVVNSWCFPLILLLFKSLNVDKMSIEMLNSIVKYLNIGCDNFKKDINFSKIMHAVAVNVNKNPNSLSDDMLKVLLKIINDNETAFKMSCLKLIK